MYIPSSLIKISRFIYSFRLLENAFVKLPHPRQDLILNSLCRTAPQNLSPISHENYLWKRPSMFSWWRHYAIAPLKNHVAVYAPSIFARKCGLKFVNILNLAKRIPWQNRSLGWGIIQVLECYQFKSLRALHWDLTSSWNSFLSSSLNNIKTTVINIVWLSLPP